MLQRIAPADRFRLGATFALLSALCFGVSGSFARSLLDAGWSPSAAVAARLAGGAVALTVVCAFVNRGWLREVGKHAGTVLTYGLIPIAGAQLCYYNAVQHLSVAVALLLEYTSPVLVTAWLWLSTRRRPSNRTLAGVGMAVAGIVVVLDVAHGARINGVGIAWGLAAAVCAACYFMMGDISETTADDGTPLRPLTLATGGLWVGAAAVLALGGSGLMPLRFTGNDVVLAGATMSPLVSVLTLALVACAAAYALGIIGIALLKPGFASLLGLTEVLFAVAWAWLLVGETISWVQGIGGLVVLAGLALARSGDPEPRVLLVDHHGKLQPDRLTSEGAR
ncbi:membrane protein [Mycolicibacterium insubricum]|uniref:EamA family transporter n=1 Tax=Mycolicibacterium insubricum TaxID=444597 RepID=A0A1X0D1Q3_9MYCO|nr:DMT family transporter [Mycolicibacterium insubricum]MCB9441008.1 EamA family transporter [Mycolicibacterium sp.]MCV7080969.1 EamA family transporter [Mycolicibacterium insubricum]ORA66346.1 EamA family transporter [Mycolicibacterium insubricum]BBZ66021.1 membrane protein [Mycolicibacterium insubricum]